MDECLNGGKLVTLLLTFPGLTIKATRSDPVLVPLCYNTPPCPPLERGILHQGNKSEDRGQRTEDRGQKTEDRGQKTEDRIKNREEFRFFLFHQ